MLSVRNTINQPLLSIVKYYEKHLTELTDFVNTYLAGLDISLVVSTAISLADLPPAIVDAIRLASSGTHIWGV